MQRLVLIMNATHERVRHVCDAASAPVLATSRSDRPRFRGGGEFIIMSAKKRMAALAVTAVALLGSSPAFAADMVANRTGVSAWSKGTNGQVAVKDTKGDSRAAYANYHRRYNDNHELRNHSGYGTTVYSRKDTKNYVRALQACVAINFQPDPCTSWKYR